MSTCLDSEQLFALTLTDPIDDREGSDHLRRCRSCSAAYHEIVREHELIASSLEATARSVMAAQTRKPLSVLRPPNRRKPVNRERPAIWTGVAAACTGAMAAALMLMLAGLHPGTTIPSPQLIPAAGVRSTKTAVSARDALGTDAIATASAYDPWQSSGVIFTDSADDIGYHEAMAGASNYEDLFYCDPQDDGTFCSASAGQG
jgi:hypothetical protein